MSTPQAGIPPDAHDMLAAVVGRLRELRPDLSPQAAVAFTAVALAPGRNLTSLERLSGLSPWVFRHEVLKMTRGTPENPAILVTVDGRRDRRFVHVYLTSAGVALASEAVRAFTHNNINNDTKGEHE